MTNQTHGRELPSFILQSRSKLVVGLAGRPLWPGCVGDARAPSPRTTRSTAVGSRTRWTHLG